MARHFLGLYLLIVLTLAVVSWGQDRVLQAYSNPDTRDDKPMAGALLAPDRPLEGFRGGGRRQDRRRYGAVRYEGYRRPRDSDETGARRSRLYAGFRRRFVGPAAAQRRLCAGREILRAGHSARPAGVVPHDAVLCGHRPGADDLD